MSLSTINLQKWIEENRESLKPPVGNKMVYNAGEFKVMVVGGPNRRKDYHIDPGEEFFYQLQGNMTLKIVENGEFKDIAINEGDLFLLPSFIPHSPQRPENTIGLVIERDRKSDEHDGLRWYCDNCKAVVYEEFFHCVNLGAQLKPVIERYYGSDDLRTCKSCGHVNDVPK